MPGLVIRAMSPEDLEAVCAIDRRCFPEPWSRETFAGECASPVGYYRVAELEGRVAGYLGSQIIPDEAHVTTFGVAPELRRRGVGERLLADFLLAAVQAGCRRITLEVRASNRAAEQLYRKWGFAPVSRRRGYYTDNDEDAIVMWIEDTSRFGFRTMLEERTRALAAEG
ncbi:MAG: ribosomal protein S18-alanine N-acetyltransferase [Armatimonadota bacterium]